MLKNPKDMIMSRLSQTYKRITRFSSQKAQVPACAVGTGHCPEPQPNVQDQSLRIFALDAKRDSDIIQKWERDVLPAIPSILKDTVGSEYSISLLREGFTRQDSSVCVRIQCPIKPTQLNREDVQDAIWEHLSNYTGMLPQLRFIEGKTRNLMESLNQKAKVGSSSGSIIEPESDAQFPHHKSYWPNPGMGGSVGIFGNREVSGTLGGYIRVDSKRYILIAYHLIEEVRIQNLLRHDRGGLRSIMLTSPSLADVDELKRYLTHSLRSSNARIRKLLSDRGESVLPSDMQVLLESADQLDDETVLQIFLLQQIAKKNEEDFIVGKLVYWRLNEYRQQSGYPPTLNRMDWALYETTQEQRVGHNRYRYPRVPGGEELDYNYCNQEGLTIGLGDECRGVCSLEPEIPVFYEGRKSGRRRGVINPMRDFFNTRNGLVGEWCFIPEGPSLAYADFCGDSGALVLREDTNEAMAMIHGHSENGLRVTPLLDILQDIREVTGASDVRLDEESPQVPPRRNLCEVADKTKRVKPYSRASLPKVDIGQIRLMLKRGTEEINLVLPQNKSPSVPSLDGDCASPGSDKSFPTNATYGSEPALPILTKGERVSHIKIVGEGEAEAGEEIDSTTP